MIQHFNNYTTRIKSTNILDLRIPPVLTSLCDGDSLLQRRRGGGGEEPRLAVVKTVGNVLLLVM